MINKTELNKLRTHIDKNKRYLDDNNVAGNDDQKHTISLSMSILIDYFGLNQRIAYESITDGGSDNKFDAFYYSDDEDELSELIIIQSKYKNVDGETGTFTEDEIKLCISNCEKFSDGEDFQDTNSILKDKITNYRKLLQENDLPVISIKLFFVTNGIIHEGHKVLNEVLSCEENNIFPYFVDATKYGNTPELMDGTLEINIKNKKDKTDSIFALDEHFKGEVVSCKISSLMKFYQETGEKVLLNNNVRYKLKRSTVNKEIEKSFLDDPSKFCFLNNGITIVCEEFKALPTGNDIHKTRLTKPSIVNGGQTVATLYDIYVNNKDKYKDQFDSAYILLRIYAVPNKYIINIAKATNTQNPINVVDLHSNDKAQDTVNKYFEKSGVGMIYKIGSDTTFYDDTITNESLLQVYASLYGDEPAKAKVSKRTIFNQYYAKIFNESLDDQMCKKLYRCYEISKFLEKNDTEDKVIIQNAFYTIIYVMKQKDKNVFNENIPSEQIKKHFSESFVGAMIHVNKIIEQKQKELKTKFSLNNLFKSKEIKDLMDLELGI